MFGSWFHGLLLPPGCLFVWIGIGLLVARRWKRAGLRIAAAGGIALVLSSMPVVGHLLERSHFPSGGFEDPLAAAPVDAIVILGGDVEVFAPEYGNEATLGALTLQRLRYGARLARATGLPVCVCGGPFRGGRTALGELMRACLEEDFGVQARWIEKRSRNTHENARNAARLLRPDGVRRVLLVSHAFHLPRARRQFELQGLEVVPAPTVFPLQGRLDPADFAPSSRALRETSLVVREWLARAWYRVRYADPAAPAMTLTPLTRGAAQK